MSKFPSWKNVLLATCFSSKEIVVSDMRVLNVYVKQGLIFSEKYKIYRLKDLLIAWLYKKGYCIGVTEQVQELKCTSFYHMYSQSDWDDVDDADNRCSKCGGTGIYRRTELYTYSFVMGNTSWGWHQPKSHAVIQPMLTYTDSRVITEASNRSLDEYGDVQQRYWNIWIFLFLKGMIKPTKQDLRSAITSVYWKIKYPWISFKRSIRIKVNEMMKEVEKDEPPF